MFKNVKTHQISLLQPLRKILLKYRPCLTNVYGKHKQLDHPCISHKAFFLSMYDVLCVYYFFFPQTFHVVFIFFCS